MKKFGTTVIGALACLVLAVTLGWSALPTNAESGADSPKAERESCPLRAAKAAKAERESCPLKAAGLAKAEAGGCCADKAAKPAVNTEGAAKAEALLAAAGKSGDCGECPLAKAAKLSAAVDGKGECCADGAAKQVAAKDGACSDGSACDAKDIAKLVVSDSRFTTLALAVKAAGMEGEFQCPLQKTVLAPTNEAFQKIPAEQWAAILQDDAKLKALIANHIIKGAAMKSSCLTEAKTAKSAFGSELAVSQCPVSGKVSVNNADIVGDAIVASNGNVIAIDNVLMPADMQVAKAEVEEPVQVAAAE